MNNSDQYTWFDESRFGMFIHWGLYSLLGRGEWVQHVERIPCSEYAKLADEFKPDGCDPEQWIRLAKEAGMKYAVFTTRHHDGFCLYDSQLSDFTSVKTAAKRDFVADYVKACRKHGLKVGFYYSLLDWRFPGYFDPGKYPDNADALVEQIHAQVEELLSNYGPIDLLWFDGGWASTPEFRLVPEFWRAQELYDMARSLQPHIMINGRSGLAGDFDTPEQEVKASETGRRWESCMTIGDFCTWGYVRHNPNLKPISQLLQNLVTCASNAGNYVLNIGPKPDGSVQEEFVSIISEIGRWMKINGESIYGSERLPAGWGASGFAWPTSGGMLGACTAKGNQAYLHIFRWPGETACLVGINNKVLSAKLLATGQLLDVEQNSDGKLTLKGLPTEPVYPYDSVIHMELDGPPQAVEYHGIPLER
jgi:alpha-L-fucosidase